MKKLNHVAVKALAGTGKTTTIVWALTKVPKGIKLTDEQAAIIKYIKSLLKNFGPHARIAVMAFNKAIATELTQRLPSDIQACTFNSAGHRAWGGYIKKRLFVDANKCRKIFRDIYQDMPWKERQSIEPIVDDLCGFLKSTYHRGIHDEFLSAENIVEVSNQFSVALEERHIEMVQRVMQKSIDEKTLIDFNDQIFKPAYYDIPMPQYDILGVDESQDLNRPKQECSYMMVGDEGNIIIIGDTHQAIYGFNGADSQSMPRMIETLEDQRGCNIFPLTETRRCSRDAVSHGNCYVPELRAHESNLEGFTKNIESSQLLETITKDRERERMVICTTNAPLTKVAFQMIAANIRCFIQGRDIGATLKRAIKDTKMDNPIEAYIKACDSIDQMIEKERKGKFPSDEKIGLLNDRKACLGILTNGCDTMQKFESRIDDLFKDSGRPGDIRLSSGHKSKGLEADDIYLLKPESIGCPFNKKKASQMDVEQAQNLAYVIHTRTKDGTYLVETPPKESDEE